MRPLAFCARSGPRAAHFVHVCEKQRRGVTSPPRRAECTLRSFTPAQAPTRGYGATAARLTPDQKVGSSNLSGLIGVWVWAFSGAAAQLRGLHLPRCVANLPPGLLTDNRGYGVTAARLTPDQKVGSSNLSGLMTKFPMCLQPQSWNGKSLLRMSRVEQRAVGSYKFF